MNNESDTIKYPIGKFSVPRELNEGKLLENINAISSFPESLRKKIINLSSDQLGFQYRQGSWNVAQIVHHLADSHMNSFIRFKLCLTEDKPVIKPYNEASWATLADSQSKDVGTSLQLLDSLHNRWTILLKAMSFSDFTNEFYHPEQDRFIPLFEALALYAWHGDHHLAHIDIALSGKTEHNLDE